MKQIKYTITFDNGDEVVKFWHDGHLAEIEARILAQADQIRNGRTFQVASISKLETDNSQLIYLEEEKE